jgi:hypothetical protein
MFRSVEFPSHLAGARWRVLASRKAFILEAPNLWESNA